MNGCVDWQEYNQIYQTYTPSLFLYWVNASYILEDDRLTLS